MPTSCSSIFAALPSWTRSAMMYAVFVLGSNSALALLTASASVISPGGTSSTDWTILRMPCASSDEIPFPPKRLD